MAELEIQSLLEGVATELGVGVALDDVELRYLAHTAHAITDDVRQASIVGRQVPAELRKMMADMGVLSSMDPVRAPAIPEVGLGYSRWCIPVRFRNTLFGYIWVLEAREIKEEELGVAVEAAPQIGALLYRRRLSSQIDSDLLRLLLFPNPENESTAADARALGTYSHAGPIAVIVAGPPDCNELGATGLSDLAAAVQRVAEQAMPETVLAGVIGGLGVLLAPLRDTRDLAPAKRLASNLLRLIEQAYDKLSVLTAIGGAAELEQASQSFAEARRALRMVRAMPDLGPVATWDDLGVFRALAFLPSVDVGTGVVDSRVRALLSDDGLAGTAETFLDLAGDVQATAARLFVHRTTLYQRLDRIATLYKLDLRRSGDHRLITHLGLKLARVTAAS